jgi:hypothetical protein
MGRLKSYGLAIFLACTGLTGYAEQCDGLRIVKSQMPVYPPIGVAARMDARVSLSIEVSKDAKIINVRLNSGANWFTAKAEDYVNSMVLEWDSPGTHNACTQTVIVNYKILPEFSDLGFRRVTVNSISDILIEAKQHTPTVNY